MPTKAGQASCKAWLDHVPKEIFSNVVKCSPSGDHAIRLDFEASYDIDTLHTIVGALGVALPPALDQWRDDGKQRVICSLALLGTLIWDQAQC